MVSQYGLAASGNARRNSTRIVHRRRFNSVVGDGTAISCYGFSGRRRIAKKFNATLIGSGSGAPPRPCSPLATKIYDATIVVSKYSGTNAAQIGQDKRSVYGIV